MTEELELKLVEEMTEFIIELICEQIDYNVLNEYDELDEVLWEEWDVNNPKLAEWFKILRNVDIKKFDKYTIYENSFYIRKTVNYYVAVEIENMLTFSENEPTDNYIYFNPKDYFEDEEELKEINEFISTCVNDPDAECKESFADTLFHSVLNTIKTIWYIYNLLKMEEDEIKKLQF